MAKLTVQQMILDEVRDVKVKVDKLIPVVEGLKVKAAIAGGVAGLIGTGLVTMLLSAFK